MTTRRIGSAFAVVLTAVALAACQPHGAQRYAGSTMERVWVEGFTPSQTQMAGNVTTSSPASAAVSIGAHDMRFAVPNRCAAFIRARIGRPMTMRVDHFIAADDTTLSTLQPDEAKAVLCGDVAGRDAPVGR